MATLIDKIKLVLNQIKTDIKAAQTSANSAVATANAASQTATTASTAAADAGQLATSASNAATAATQQVGTLSTTVGTLQTNVTQLTSDVQQLQTGGSGGPATSDVNYSVVTATSVTAESNKKYYAYTEGMAGDPYWNNVVLAMTFAGPDGSASYVDLLGGSFTTTGSVTIKTAPSKFGNGCAYFNGSSYISFPPQAKYYPDYQDFEIAFWFETSQTTSGATILACPGTGNNGIGAWTIQLIGDNSSLPMIYWGDYSGNGPFMTASNISPVNDGKQHYFQWIRKGNTHFMCIDSVVAATMTTTVQFAHLNQPIVIGNDLNNSGRNFIGYLSDLRFTFGGIRQPAVPSAPMYTYTSYIDVYLPSAPAQGDHVEVHSGLGPGRARYNGNGNTFQRANTLISDLNTKTEFIYTGSWWDVIATASSTYEQYPVQILQGLIGYQLPLSKTDTASPCLVKTAANTLSIKAGTRVRMTNTSEIVFTSQTPVAMPTLTPGSDYSVWVGLDGSVQAILDPYNNPPAAPSSGAVKIGGFHYSLLAAGSTITSGNFPTSAPSMIWTQSDVDNIAGINKFSIWDLTYRPKADPHGMTCVAGCFWVDIYLCAQDHNTYGTSCYNVAIANGNAYPRIPVIFGGTGTDNYTSCSLYESNEIGIAHAKRALTHNQFSAAMFGVREATSLGGTTVPSIATRASGFTSRWGVEQATGNIAVWGDIMFASGGSSWSEAPGRGYAFGVPYGQTLGGCYDYSGYSGSRSVNSSYTANYTNSGVGLRYASEHYNGYYGGAQNQSTESPWTVQSADFVAQVGGKYFVDSSNQSLVIDYNWQYCQIYLPGCAGNNDSIFGGLAGAANPVGASVYSASVVTNANSIIGTAISMAAGYSLPAFTIGANSCFEFGSSNWKFRFKYATTQNSGRQAVFSLARGSGDWELAVLTNWYTNQLTVHLNSPGNIILASNVAINDGAFHEFEFGRLGTKFYLSVDGTLQSTSADWSGSFATGLAVNPMWFGNDQVYTGRNAIGMLYDFQYYLGIGPNTANYVPLTTMPFKSILITVPSNAKVGDSFRFKTGPGPYLTKLSDGRSYLPNQDITLVYNGSSFQE